MPVVALRRGAAGVLLSAFVAACTKDAATSPGLQASTSCPGINPGPAPARLALPQNPSGILQALGNGLDTVRYQGEVAVRGSTAYTTSWSVRKVQGKGEISFSRREWPVGKAFSGQPVALRPTIVDGKYDVVFCLHKVAEIDLREGQE